MADKLLQELMRKYSCGSVEELESKRQDLIHRIETAKDIGAFSHLAGGHEGYTKTDTHIAEWELQLSEIENALRETDT